MSPFWHNGYPSSEASPSPDPFTASKPSTASSPLPRKVLIITYYWPPGSGAGVQRWLKFSKYLPSFGWEPIILTVDPHFAAYPAIDNSLEEEISPGLKVFKTKATDYFSFYKKDKKNIPSAGFANSNDKGVLGKLMRFVRGNFFIPDPRKGWNKYAFRKACEIIENEGIRHIITTSPPHSTQLIGLRLRNKYPDIKWIADFRDPWTDIYYYNQFYPTIISRSIDRKLEKQVLKSSDKIITVGKSLKDILAAKIPGDEDKISVITNGFDEDDFKGLEATTPEKLTISYIGTLSDAYPLSGFLDALCGFHEKGNDFMLKFVGSVSPQQKEAILSKIDKSSVEFVPYVDHSIAIRYMLEASTLLLIIPDHQSNKSIITGKLFEYIASGKPIICLGPVNGDAAEILNNSGAGRTFDYPDIKLVEKYITNLSVTGYLPDNQHITEYSRKSLAEFLSDIL